MRLEHDNTGSNPDWKVDYVSIMGQLTIKQGWHRLEKYLKMESFLEKSLKIMSALKGA